MMRDMLILHEFWSDWDHDGNTNKLRRIPLELMEPIFNEGDHLWERSPTLEQIRCCSPLCQNEKQKLCVGDILIFYF